MFVFVMYRGDVGHEATVRLGLAGSYPMIIVVIVLHEEVCVLVGVSGS